MNFCEFCGSRLEDGQACGCPASVQARAGAAESGQPGQPIPPAPPQQQPQQPPPFEQPFYPPPPGAYPPPPPGYPPQGAPGYPPQGAPGYPPPYPPPPYGYAPSPAGQQVKQTFGEVKGIISGFARDPYGAAVRGNSLTVSISLILLAVQAVAYFLLDLCMTSKYFSEMTSGMSRERRKSFMEQMGPEFGDYVKVFLGGMAIIALFFLVIFLASKLAKIAMEPRALLSTVSMSSIPMSAAFVVMAVLFFVLGVGGEDSAKGIFALYILIFTFACVCSTLLLEIGLRSAMPPGTGNVARLFALAASYAVTYAALFFFVSSMDEPIGFLYFLTQSSPFPF